MLGRFSFLIRPDLPEPDFGPSLLRVRPRGLDFPSARHSSRLTEGTGALDIIKCEMESRVENRRSDCSLPVDIRRGFRRATSVRFGVVLFPVPAHRTGLADFPHPALGKDTRCSV